jgi:hypothetical protein
VRAVVIDKYKCQYGLTLVMLHVKLIPHPDHNRTVTTHDRRPGPVGEVNT